MTETPQQAQQGVADAVNNLSDSSRALVRHEIAAVQTEMLAKAKQALPAAGLLGAAGFFGVLSAAAAYRLSIRLPEQAMPPAAAVFTATAAYGAAAGAAGAVGFRQLREMPPLFPADTARETAKTVTSEAARAAQRGRPGTNG
jgi:hypothetical protein